ncbi:MAG: aminotransferase class III-fold pyridoxal phosphate-dependent enzyme [Gammaproteobacteria bacterium]|nr:aminotransferase class III-fold pyridoxal phosphate-dependent enzyme [Gammaproteobacteria bacterium]
MNNEMTHQNQEKKGLNIIKDALKTTICEATGMAVENIADSKSLIDLDIDSLMIIQINNKLQRQFGVDLPNTLFFDPTNTLSVLVEYIFSLVEPTDQVIMEDASQTAAKVGTPLAGTRKAAGNVLFKEPDQASMEDASQATARVDTSLAGTGEDMGNAPANPLGSTRATGTGRGMIEGLMVEQLRVFADLTRRQIDALKRLQPSSVVDTDPQPGFTPPLPTPEPAQPPVSTRSNTPVRSTIPSRSTGKSEVFVPYYSVQDNIDSSSPNGSTEYLKELSQAYCLQSAISKTRTQADRLVFANNRNIVGFTLTTKEMTYQIIAERAAGGHIWDIDGNRYVDLTQGFGSSLLGHGHPLLTEAIRTQLDRTWAVGPISNDAGEVARRICRMTGTERVAFYNSGTEAVMVALRLARTATSRSKVVFFEGAYHGMFDSVLAIMRHGAKPGTSMPMAPGVTDSMVADTIILRYDDPESLRIIESRASEIAAVLVEPVQSRRPDVQPRTFLHRLRELTHRIGSALIFDEMVTGFRIAPGGAQAWFGVQADLAVYGKVAGGAMPVGIVAGSARFMDGVDGGMWTYGDRSRPDKLNTFVGGTFCSHPLTMAATCAMLQYLEDQGAELQRELNARTRRLCARFNTIFAEAGLPIHVVQFASLFRFVIPKTYDLFFYRLQIEGIYIWERHGCFLSTAHDVADIEHIVKAIRAGVQWLSKYVTPEAGSAPPNYGLEHIPASAAQRVMFQQSQCPNSDQAAYHVPFAYIVEGPLPVDRFESALSELCLRHEALRTSFHHDGETLWQRIHPVADFELRIKTIDEKDIDAFIKSMLSPFDITSPSLLRCGLARLGQNRHLLAFNLHHLIFDGVSIKILLEEFIALVNNQALESKPTQYREYIEWQQSYLGSPAAKRDEAAWREILAGLPSRVELPTSATTTARTFRCCGLGLDISEPEKLRALARTHSVTLNMLFHALFQVWLSVISKRSELFYAGPTSGRLDARFDSTIGLLIGVFIYRSQLTRKTRFVDLLGEVRATTMRLLPLQHVPLERLLTMIPGAEDGVAPFEVGINYESAIEPVNNSGLSLTEWPVTEPGMSLSCVVDICDSGTDIRLDIAHEPDRYSEAAVEQWAELFNQLARDLAADPERPIADIISGVTGTAFPYSE